MASAEAIIGKSIRSRDFVHQVWILVNRGLMMLLSWFVMGWCLACCGLAFQRSGFALMTRAFLKPAGVDYREHRHEHERQREKEYNWQPMVRGSDNVLVVVGEDYRSGRRRRGADDTQGTCRQKPPGPRAGWWSLVTVVHG